MTVGGCTENGRINIMMMVISCSSKFQRRRRRTNFRSNKGSPWWNGEGASSCKCYRQGKEEEEEEEQTIQRRRHHWKLLYWINNNTQRWRLPIELYCSLRFGESVSISWCEKFAVSRYKPACHPKPILLSSVSSFVDWSSCYLGSDESSIALTINNNCVLLHLTTSNYSFTHITRSNIIL